MDDKQREWGVDTYSKWDKFEEEDSGDEDAGGVKYEATQFNPGEVSVDVKDVVYFEPDVDLKRFKNMPQRDTEVWQVVVRKLRVWSATSDSKGEAENRPCRPYCVFINCIYPDGTLISQDVNPKPEQRPTPQFVLHLLLKGMKNPYSGAQRRPGKVTFVDKDLLEELYKSLQKIGVEASELSESEGVDEIVRVYSQQLVKNDIAASSVCAEQPSLLDGEDMTLPIVRGIFEAASLYLQAAPWNFFAEREGFEMRFDSKVSIDTKKTNRKNIIEPATAWVSVIGRDSIGNEKGGTFGVAVFFSRLDMEARLAPSEHEVFRDPARKPMCSYSGKTAEEVGHDLKRTKPRKFDIRTGLEIQYENGAALKAHWPNVKKYVRELTELEAGLKAKRQHWMEYECTVLFEGPTVLPYDDHDLIQQENLPLASEDTPLGPKRYPLGIALKHGQAIRPTGTLGVWLERALHVVMALQSNIERNSLRGMKQEVAIEIETQSAGKEVAYVRGSPVFLTEEVQAAYEKAQAANKVDEQEGQQESQSVERDGHDEHVEQDEPADHQRENENANDDDQDDESSGRGCVVG